MEHIYVQKARFACPHCGRHLDLSDVVQIEHDDDDEEDQEEEDED